MLIAAGCGTESAESLLSDLGQHPHATSPPEGASVLEEVFCDPADFNSNDDCKVVYATELDLDQLRRYYKERYGGWQRLVDNREGGRYMWRMERRDDSYKVVVTVSDPEEWPGPTGPGTKLVAIATVVARK